MTTAITLREICRRVGKSEGYLSAFLTPPPGRRRQSLDIDTLRELSRELDIPLYKLVEPGFGINVQQLYEEMQTVAGLSVSDPMSGLTPRDREKVRDLIALVRAWDERNSGPEPRRPPGRKHRRREDASKEG